MKHLTAEDRRIRTIVSRPNWLFEIEPYPRPQADTLSDVRDNLRLKKLLKSAVNRDVAPISLIDTIRAGIRK
jgi:hypothetical protein